jgi:LuxR family transcriptional regulator, maltose regulon positive regulatory protein
VACSAHLAPKVVADLHQRPYLRISWFADFARIYLSLTHVQWFYSVQRWFPISAAEVPGAVSQKGFVMSGRALFRVHVLGRFRLLKGDIPVTIPPRLRKPQELLQALIAFGGTEVSAGVLIDALWPDSEGDAAYHALETALYRLRQLLGTRDAVRMEGGKVSLKRDQLWVDMWEFEEELRRTHDSDANGIERLGRLRLLYQGHFLQQEAEKPWVLRARQELRDRLLRTIRDAARQCEQARRWEDAANLYRSGIELDPLNEGLYRGLMLCHQALGDHSEALQAYKRCRELLTRFLGIPPNAKTQALYHSVRERATYAPVGGGL